MNDYNLTLKSILDESLILVDRIDLNGEIISASHVRTLLKQQKIQEALSFIPKECQSVFKLLAYGKYCK